MLAFLVTSLLAAPTLVTLPAPPPTAPTGMGGRLGLAQLGATPTLVWSDDRLSTASASRWVPSGVGWSGNSLWLGEVSVGATPRLSGVKLLCPASGYTNVLSPRIAALANGLPSEALIVYVAVGGALQQVNTLGPVPTQGACGDALSAPSLDPIEGLNVTAIGQAYLVTWVVNGELQGRWVDRSGNIGVPLVFKTGVDGAAAVARSGTGSEAAVLWTSLPLPGTPEWTVVPSLGVPDAGPRALLTTSVATNFFGAAVAEGGAFALLHTEVGLVRQPFDGGTGDVVAQRATRPPLMVRTTAQAHLVASTEPLGVLPFVLRDAPGALIGPAAPMLNGYTAEALTSLPLPGAALLALTDGAGRPYLSAASGAGIGTGASSLTPPVGVLEARPLQRLPSIVWDGAAWLVAWEELEPSAKVSTARFARLSPRGVPLTLKLMPNAPPLETPTLLRRPGGALVLLAGPPSARQLFEVTLEADVLLLGAASTPSSDSRPSVLLGDRRAVQWGISPAKNTSFDDSAKGPWVGTFQAAAAGVAAEGALWLPGQRADGSAVLAVLPDVNFAAPADLILPLGLSQVQGPLAVGARTEQSALQLLLTWNDASAQPQMGLIAGDGGLRALGPAPVSLPPGVSPVGVEEGWFLVAADMGGLTTALVPPGGGPSAVESIATPGELPVDLQVAAGPPGYRAVAWTSLDPGLGGRTSRIRLALFEPSDGGVLDGGAEPQPDAGVEPKPDGGPWPGDGGSTGPGFNYTACGCQGSAGSPLIALGVAVLGLRARRRGH